MTCVWKGLINGLHKNNLLKRIYFQNKPSPQEFVICLQKYSIKTYNVTWNGENLSDQLLDENFKRIHEFNINFINNGYDCSSCDPYLLLVCQIFRIHIDHYFNKNLIKYRYKFPIKETKTLTFYSNTGHFWN